MSEKISLGLILCLNFLIVISWKPTADYCKEKCPGKHKADEHTACKCKLIKPRKIIEDNLKKFRQDMVDVHNHYTNLIASGGEKDRGYPEAANMMAVSYSLELEYIAKCYAGIFVYGHDKCRKMAGSKYNAGQNIGGISIIEPVKNNSTGIVWRWYNELNYVKPDERKNFRENWNEDKNRAMSEDIPIGHFSQLVWWSHKLVGCTRVNNEENKVHDNAFKNALICNYAGLGHGNNLNKPMYKEGKKCSECPEGTACNSAYTALCGTIDDDIPKDTVETAQDTAATTVDTVLLGNTDGNYSSSRTGRLYQNKLLLVFILLVLCRNLN